MFRRWAVRLALVGGILLLLRLGLPWIAAAGAALLGLLRFAAPHLIRLAPLWLMRKMQPGPRHGAGSGRAKPARMSRAQALEVLNLSEGSSREAILSAHRELIKRVHPDRGGSTYLASEVNQARDVLLSDETG